jgi:hypothetical protein
LRARQNKILASLQKCLKPPPELAMQGFGFGEIGAAEPQSPLDLVAQRIFVGLGIRAQPLAMRGGERPGAEGLKGKVRAREIRLRLFHDAPKVLEGLPLAVDDGADARVERDSAEIAEPGDANAFERASERSGEALP